MGRLFSLFSSAPPPTVEDRPLGPAAGIHEAAYQASAAAIERQRHVLDSFRTRAGLVFTVGTLATSFLSSGALDQLQVGVWSLFAIFFFVCMFISAAAVLWPARHLYNDAAPNDLLKLAREAETNEEFFRRRIIDLDLRFRRNERELLRYHIAFQLASIFLLAEILCWLMYRLAND